MKTGKIDFLGMSFSWQWRRKSCRSNSLNAYDKPYRVHLGPGPNWIKPDNHWINIDVDPSWGDIVVDFKDFTSLPIESNTVECIYGSHVFEHMSIWVTDDVFSECLRVLQPGGAFRLILPDVEKSIREYLAGNNEFPLFRRRRERALENYNLNYSLFDCLREDFLSRSGQPNLLGRNALAHQNAWDYKSIENDLIRAGFDKVFKLGFQDSHCNDFGFEGSYSCEAMEHDRSLYVEAYKSNKA